MKEHNQYEVKMDGSGRLSLRNRRFLRSTTPYTRRETDWNRYVPKPTQVDLQPAPSVPEPCQPTPSPEAMKPIAPATAATSPQPPPTDPVSPDSRPRRSGRERRTPVHLKEYKLYSVLATGTSETPHEWCPWAHPGEIDSGLPATVSEHRVGS